MEHIVETIQALAVGTEGEPFGSFESHTDRIGLAGLREIFDDHAVGGRLELEGRLRLGPVDCDFIIGKSLD